MLATSIISVIVPCFNQGKYLPDALQSVFDQTYIGWECIIINDGSTDNTEQVAMEWASRDARFKYFYKENGGLSSARNKGLKECKGDYIQFLDADDCIAVDKFSESLQFIPTANVIISNFKMFTDKKERYTDANFLLKKEQFSFYNILTGWDEQFVIPIHCGLFNAALFKNICFNECLKAKEDWVMWLQIYQQAIETLFIDKPFALYRYTGNNMSQQKVHMNSNLVLAYQIIYEMIPVENRANFFKKAIRSMGTLLDETEDILAKTRKSKSYRLGNFFIDPITKILKRVNSFLF
jgi:glycosyltransferase involved in cell wall biosynthesis